MGLAALALTTGLLLTLGGSTASAAVGDKVHEITAPVSGVDTFCSVGVAFDGSSLYYDRCFDTNIYKVDPVSGGLQSTFDTGIPERPNALAFDATRNGLWIGTQECQEGPEARQVGSGMPIYFWDFDDNSVVQQFTIPFSLVNPATTESFLFACFDDGLAFNAQGAGAADDELFFSDDVDKNLGLFRPDGTLVAGYDSTSIDPSLAANSGLAIGGPNLYMGNDGGGDVFRATVGVSSLGLVDQFTSGDDRQEDMECDPVTFAPVEAMWVRTTPQGGAFPDVMTAYEIESGSCGVGGQPPQPPQAPPPPAAAPPPVAPAAVPVAQAKPTAKASIRGPRKCVRNKTTIKVRGRNISTVIYKLNGKRIKKGKGNKSSVKIKAKQLRRSRANRVTARVRYKSATGAKAQTKRFTLRRCARKAAKPKFTG